MNKQKYDIKKRREFLEHMITELNVARDNLKILEEKFKEYLGAGVKVNRAGYLCGIRGRIGKAGEYILKEKELVVERVKYMEDFIGNAN